MSLGSPASNKGSNSTESKDNQPRNFVVQSKLHQASAAKFVHLHNCGKLGLDAIQKIMLALRILAYGEAADRNDEYLRIGESTSHKSLERFGQAIIAIFGNEYL
ncbi:hypothetical protein PSTT_13606 [Puccinia striiformis]|uniref:Uncharacterized protein n=1 Tax=Puccinia striiformis TaxID=27350 RepID=A0A2S4UR96_9BASI|nr:hypothetical protein PSTT_13606 [Puccinia striiformis]